MKNLPFHNVSFTDPLDNVLYDEVLLNLAERGEMPGAFRLWESPSLFIVLGRSQDPAQELFAGKVREDGIPVLKRISGGGTVVQGPGCLNFAFVLKKDGAAPLQDISASYRYILEETARALEGAGLRAGFRPVCDLVTGEDDRKFSGNAQRRARKFILHHGTILYALEPQRMTRYLRLPGKRPEYRKDRTHENFVTNVSLSRQQLEGALRGYFRPRDCSKAAAELCARELTELKKRRGRDAVLTDF